jgi:protein-S-isoprenylcysteine O-methyltransferase Ste14
MNVHRGLLPTATFAFFIGAFVVPAIRQRLRTGSSGVLFHRSKDPVQRLVSVGVGLLFVGVGAWSIVFAWRGPEALGVWAAPGPVSDLGVGLGILAFAVMVLAQAQMGRSWRVGIDPTRTELVTHGLFAIVRNPIYTSVLLVLAGVFLVTPAAWTASGAIFGAFLLVLQTRLEEAHLLAMHGDAYRSYARRAGRFLPGIGRGV